MTSNELLAKEWLEWLDKQPKNAVLSPDEGYIYLNCLALENDKKLNEQTIDFIENQFAGKLMFKRVKYCHTYTVTNSVILWIISICNSPGEIVIYCNYFQYKCNKDNISNVSMKDLSKWFPNGFFSHEVLTEAWNKQKLHEGNIVDLGIIPNLYNTNGKH